jgi:hypothetical protein|tara:strand:+ start:134 stop:247 length:114 start_codon:yes stop_codon:yes gene_type:complete
MANGVTAPMYRANKHQMSKQRKLSNRHKVLAMSELRA